MKQDAEKRIKNRLAEKYAAYVLITCQEPSEDGSMQVEMSYAGDSLVAAYLMQCAQSFLDDSEKEEEDLPQPTLKDKIHPF